MLLLRVHFLLLIFVVFLSTGVIAQTAADSGIPRYVKFSGSLKNDLHKKAAGVTFAIYDKEDGVAPLWLETQSVTVDETGHYAVLLGSTKGEGLPASIFANGEARWIGVQAEGEAEQPRTLLVSVPYALKAADADTLGGKPLSAFLLADSSNASSTTKSKRLGESSRMAPEATAAINNGATNGTVNYLAKFDSASTVVNSAVFENGGLVGIGTTTPGATLDVAGTVRSTSTTDSTASLNGALTTLGGLGVAQTGYFGNGIVLESQNSASFIYGTSGLSTRGSSLASSAGTSGFYSGTFFNNNGTGAGDSGVQRNTGLPSWRMAMGGGTAEWNGADNFTIGRVAPAGNYLAPNVLLKLTNGGNLGVGTSSPAEKLDVIGRVRVLDATDSASATTGAIYTPGGLGVGKTGYFVNGIVLESQNAGSFVFGTSGSSTKGSSLASSAGTSASYNGAYFTSNGFGAGDNGAQRNVALPSWRMALGGGAAEWNGADTFAIARVAPGANFNTPSILMNINNAGNVGIGTSSPTAKLDVNGLVRAANGFMFADNSVQTTAATLTGVTAGSGLAGGGSSGNVSLSLLTSCTSGQLLKWNGTAWACAADATSGGGGSTTIFDGSSAANSAIVTVNQHGAGVTNPDAVTNIPPAAVMGFADSTTGFTAGVYGKSTSPNGLGVLGIVTGSPTTQDSTAIIGIATSTTGKTKGVTGQSSSPDGAGGEFSNDNNSGTALRASVGPKNGGTSISSLEVRGSGININGGTISIQGPTGPNASVQIGGSTTVIGNLSVNGALSKSSGSFKIDHPLDPAGKYLYHSFVESPDMMNIYNGVVLLDAKGEAWITMPDWFEALNMDFRYQLTSIGRFAPVFIAKEMTGNRFKISGGRANGKVSWQVTGIRHDAYADAHRIKVEEVKPAAEQGTYIHPELFNKFSADKLASSTTR